MTWAAFQLLSNLVVDESQLAVAEVVVVEEFDALGKFVEVEVLVAEVQLVVGATTVQHVSLMFQ
jgi:hypothetical protein